MSTMTDINIHNTEVVYGRIHYPQAEMELSLHFLDVDTGEFYEVAKTTLSDKNPFLLPIPKYDRDQCGKVYCRAMIVVRDDTSGKLLFDDVLVLGGAYLHDLGDIKITSVPTPALPLWPNTHPVAKWVAEALDSDRLTSGIRGLLTGVRGRQIDSGKPILALPYYNISDVKYGQSPSVELSLVLYTVVLMLLLLSTVGVFSVVRKWTTKGTAATTGGTLALQDAPTKTTSAALARIIGGCPTQHQQQQQQQLIHFNAGTAGSTEGEAPHHRVSPPHTTEAGVAESFALDTGLTGYDRQQYNVQTVPLAERRINPQVTRRRTITIMEQNYALREGGGVIVGEGPNDDFLAVLLTNETFVTK